MTHMSPEPGNALGSPHLPEIHTSPNLNADTVSGIGVVALGGHSDYLPAGPSEEEQLRRTARRDGLLTARGAFNRAQLAPPIMGDELKRTMQQNLRSARPNTARLLEWRKQASEERRQASVQGRPNFLTPIENVHLPDADQSNT